jgi:hypothetical protein
MRSELEVRRELRRVEKLLQHKHDIGEPSGDMWMVEQTLLWLLGHGSSSPVEIEEPSTEI